MPFIWLVFSSIIFFWYNKFIIIHFLRYAAALHSFYKNSWRLDSNPGSMGLLYPTLPSVLSHTNTRTLTPPHTQTLLGVVIHLTHSTFVQSFIYKWTKNYYFIVKLILWDGITKKQDRFETCFKEDFSRETGLVK